MRTLKRIFCNAAAAIVYYGGLLRLYRAVFPRHDRVYLMYHNIADDPNPRGAYRDNLSPEIFRHQMAFLRCHCSVADIDAPAAGPREVVITFDDGLETVRIAALPILDEHGFGAVVFPVLDWIGRPGHLSWEDLAALNHSGRIRFGSHTVSHDIVGIEDLDELRDQIVRPKTTLEQRLGVRVEAFAFPGSRIPRHSTLRDIVTTDFRLSFGVSKTNRSWPPPYRIARIDAAYCTRRHQLAVALAGVPYLSRKLGRP
ncbi:MAG: hypothetical protein CMJ50_00355 [Planctomycetaceae bacterium]|nr:hypothetical protein [Planctomycetaceae bacterium]